MNGFRSNVIWEKKGDDWQLIDSIMNHNTDKELKQVALKKKEDCMFNPDSKRTKQLEVNDYTLLGRGWVDEH